MTLSCTPYSSTLPYKLSRACMSRLRPSLPSSIAFMDIRIARASVHTCVYKESVYNSMGLFAMLDAMLNPDKPNAWQNESARPSCVSTSTCSRQRLLSAFRVCFLYRRVEYDRRVCCPAKSSSRRLLIPIIMLTKYTAAVARSPACIYQLP